MFVRFLLYVMGGIFLAGFLFACGASQVNPAPTPTLDLVATEVAIKRAAAATLTAEAVAAAPVEVAATETPVPTATTETETPGDIIELPTDTPTDVPPPTATDAPPPPTPPLFVDVPVDGGQSNLEGNIVVPGFTLDQLSGPESDEVIFRDRLVFNVKVFDPHYGHHDGAGIEEVRIKIFDPHGDKVHERTERNAAYCIFGGGEPDCNVLMFYDTNFRWPEEGQPEIDNGLHRAEVDIKSKDNQTETWQWRFWVQKP